MSCILCAPEECDRLAMRIIAQKAQLVQGAAKLAQFDDYSTARLAADLYRENHRAFYARYEGRHMEGVESPTTDVRDLPEVSDASDLEKLESSLSFFSYQCSEGDCYASPVYRFVKILLGKVSQELLSRARGEHRGSWSIA